jgi:Concanavalin A-like lectin/glucanases superfamily
MKYLYLTLVIVLSTFFSFAQQKKPLIPQVNNLASNQNVIGCSLFSNAANYTCNTNFTYSAATNDNHSFIGPVGGVYGCLYSVPNQDWFIIDILSDAYTLNFHFTNSSNVDVDAAIWGKITNADLNNTCNAILNSPLTCDYSPDATPDLVLSNVHAGEKYVMVVTNFSNYPTNITVSQPSGGNVNYCKANIPSCNNYPTAQIRDTTIVYSNSNQGAISIPIQFSGNSPYNFILSNGTSGITSSSSYIYSYTPTDIDTIRVTSVSNNCGVGTVSGNAIVQYRASTIMACLPLNGNAQDYVGNHHGTISGVLPTTDRFGRMNSAYLFDFNHSDPSLGSLDYISLANKQDFVNNIFSISAWVSLTVVPNINDRLTWPIGKDIFSITDDNTFGNDQDKWSINESSYNTGSSIVANTWYHVVFVRTTTTEKIYINGLLVSTNPTASPNISLEYYYSNSSEMTKVLIGGREGWRGYVSHTFAGKIDDVRYYKGSLSAPQVQDLFNAEDYEQPCINLMISKKTGNWQDASTWSCGVIPSQNDVVLIKAGHEVIVDGITPVVSKIRNFGKITFLKGGEIKLRN